jgi:PAS domain S-box-containing protein
MANPPLSLCEYQAIVEQAPIMIWRSNTTGKCDYFNERWLRFTGRTAAQEHGDGWVEGVHPEDREKCIEDYLRAFGQRQSFELQYRLRRNDGLYRWISDVGVPFTDDSGEFAGYIGSCIDVTDTLELEAVLRKAHEREMKTLRGLLPICAYCKQVRDDRGYWQQIEVYIRDHSEADFSHSICPSCMVKHFSELSATDEDAGR